jgi:hypothetical protein
MRPLRTTKPVVSNKGPVNKIDRNVLSLKELVVETPTMFSIVLARWWRFFIDLCQVVSSHGRTPEPKFYPGQVRRCLVVSLNLFRVAISHDLVLFLLGGDPSTGLQGQ